MPKYRLLTIEELSELEKEFVEYLVINGITKDDWQKLQMDDPQKRDEITHLFSDVVFERIMRNAEYLIKRDKHSIFAFKCDENNIHLASIETGNTELDFTSEKGLEELRTSPPDDLKGYTASKKYQGLRELEIFQMIQNGCTISDKTWYEALVQII